MNIIDQSFDEAVSIVNNFNKTPNNEELLMLYKFYKQSTIGNNTNPEPFKINFKAHSKWSSWNSVKDMKKEDAKQNYINLSIKLFNKYNK